MQSRDEPRQDPPPEQAAVPRLEARTLMRGGREVIIQHRASRYRLRITSTGKLILTK